MKKLVTAAVILSWLGIAIPALAHEHEGAKRHGMKHARHECTDKNYKPGSEEFRNCMKGEKQEMKQEWKEHKEAHKQKMKEKKQEKKSK